MRNLYIIGARGCGREVYDFFMKIHHTLPDVKCIGFLDDKLDALDGFEGYPPIIEPVETFVPRENDVFVCALGDPLQVKHYTSIIESKGGNFLSLISPNASIGRNTQIGDGSIILGWTAISCDIKLGRHTYMGVFSNLGHDVKVGNCCHIGAYTFLGGGVSLGDCVTCHPRVNVLPRKKIGNNSIIGTASVVIRNVKDNVTVFGIPAKQI